MRLSYPGFTNSYVGDVVGTGSSRKSATNSIMWYFGEDIPNVPNKRTGSVCIGNKIAPIFYNTMEDSGLVCPNLSRHLSAMSHFRILATTVWV
jgi:aconitate hydratase 2/2-methylisocitrate dehydratase